ncbi:DEAD/DEAH box helicase [Paenibacillus sp. Soil750]|uniref:DEAD/DEAH box helicase n=1 Tax=Paenibacillus sp. Soil750 TaxID=1736398 RepID=UPI0006F86503|nr:DEAD/DEAH box helicase [Paenibacillus sp. Soil750]KRE75404.1 helicase SNF [Paenibacillus sp. Soil750]
MMTLAPIHMRIQRLPSGSFALYGETEQANAVPGYMLRKQLFAWHERSFYGTGLEVTRIPYGDAILLSPAMALDYLRAPGVLLHSSLTWEDGFMELQKGANFLSEAIDAGWYLPSYELWREGKNGWKFKGPVGQAERFKELCDGAFPESFWQSWFSRVVEEMLETEADFELSSLWNGLVQEHKLLQVNARGFEALLSESSWMQEEDWLLAIGWTHDDDAPYRICVQLVEPYAETYVDGTTTAKDNAADWRLRFIAQDRRDANRFVEFSSTGNVLVGDIPLAWQSDIADHLQEQTKRILRMLPELESAYQPGKIIEQLSDEAAWTFLTESSLQLVAAGISVFLPSWWEEIQKMGRPQLKAKIKSSVGSTRKAMFGMDQIMQFDWRVALGGVDLSEEEFGQLALEKKRLIYIRGKWVQLDPAYLEQIRDAMKQVERKKGLSFRDVLEMHLSEGEETLAADSDEKEKAVGIKIELNTHLRGLMKQLGQIKSIPLVERIDGLHAELRPYQVQGVSWLLFLRNMGLGSCLADDMGLGKTIQFIAYLLKVREQGKTEEKLKSKPSLLICPTSVLGNWQKELARFAPTLQIQLHYGAQRAKGEAFEASIGDADLVITSYTLAQLDEEELSSVTWDTLCLDEAQNIKNAYSKQSQAIRKLEAGQRIALTGTPIENRLTELWSIFDFVNPGYLGTLTHFNRQYVGPIEKNGDGAKELTARVQRLIRPFLLRRLKKDPAIQLDLPDKYEGKAFVRLTTEQGALYENVVQSLMEKIEESSGIEKKGLILTSLMKLKQICDHPGLFLKEIDGAGARAGVRAGTKEGAKAKEGRGALAAAEMRTRSAKLERLVEMIDELRSEGGSCLIFTQFVEMGHLLQATLVQALGEPVQFLHGGISAVKRDAMIARFQDTTLPAEERCHIFILSLKAGGTGLNLTAANHVFHYDRWWNPAVENQATDRAFRIGQTRNVQVHKFVTLGTLEERIDEMIERKQDLSEQIVGTGENWVTEMSTSELRELFALRREWIEK